MQKELLVRTCRGKTSTSGYRSTGVQGDLPRWHSTEWIDSHWLAPWHHDANSRLIRNLTPGASTPWHFLHPGNLPASAGTSRKCGYPDRCKAAIRLSVTKTKRGRKPSGLAASFFVLRLYYFFFGKLPSTFSVNSSPPKNILLICAPCYFKYFKPAL